MFGKIKYFLDQHIILSATILMIVSILISYIVRIVVGVMNELNASTYHAFELLYTSYLFQIFLFTLIYIWLLSKGVVLKENTKSIVFLLLKFFLIYACVLYMMIAIWALAPINSKIIKFTDISEILNVDKDGFILLSSLFVFPILFIRKKVVPTFLFVTLLLVPFMALLFAKIYMEEYTILYGSNSYSIINIDAPNKIFSFYLPPVSLTCSATLVLLLFVYHKIGRANNSNPITTTSNSQQDNELNEIQFDSKM